jgi:hypothetical protein
VKNFFAFAITLAIATAATVASAQNLPSIQESGDIYADIVRLDYPSSYATLITPFNMGFVSATTGPILPVTFTSYNFGNSSSPSFDADYFLGLDYMSNVQFQSAIGISFNPNVTIPLNGGTYNVPPMSLTVYAIDVYPCIEAKIPKGTYTFQATATPNQATSTPGSYVFATQTAGIWTTQFSLALTKAEGATRTLTFAHDTRVRWMLINQPGQTATASITAKFYNSGS